MSKKSNKYVLKQIDRKIFDHEGNIKDPNYKNVILNIMFFADWCGHCVRAKPIFHNIAEMNMLNSSFATVDCSDRNEHYPNVKNICKGYPTFVKYKNGKREKTYEGSSSDPESLFQFLSSH